MKVALVVDSLYCGGAEQQVVTLAKGLHGRGHDVHVISIFDRTELRDELDAAGVPVTVTGRRGKYDMTAVLRLSRLLSQIRPDLIHAYLPAASILTPMTRWIGIKAPVLLSERDVNLWRVGVRLRFEQFMRRSAVHVTCNADAIKRYLVEVEGLRPDKITVIYNGLRSERRHRPPADVIAAARRRIAAPPDATVVVCVANFNEKKRHDVLLAAFGEARATNGRLFLVMIGKGRLEHRLRQLIQEHGLSDACRIITDCLNPAAYLCATDMKAFTSDVEGCSNALLEAMAMGLPAVVTDAGGNRELIVAGRGGDICPIGDHHAIAASMLRMAADPDTARQMGRYNQARVDELFTDEVMVTSSVRLYEQLATTSDARRVRPGGNERSTAV